MYNEEHVFQESSFRNRKVNEVSRFFRRINYSKFYDQKHTICDLGSAVCTNIKSFIWFRALFDFAEYSRIIVLDLKFKARHFLGNFVSNIFTTVLLTRSLSWQVCPAHNGCEVPWGILKLND